MRANRKAPSTLSSPAPSHWNSEWQTGGIFDIMPDAIVAVDGNGSIRDVNRSLTMLFEYEKDELLGQPIEILLPEMQREHHVHHRIKYQASPRVRTMGKGLVLSGRRKDGSDIPIDIMLSPVSSVADKIVLAVIRDVTDRRRAEARISHMALHDTLTNLPNRTFFHEQMEQYYSHLDRDQTFAVLCLDLDHFKSVNDTLGHPFGDMLLRQVGERLRGCVRESDSIARLGGDEFALLVGSAAKPIDLTVLAARLIEVIDAPYDLDGHQIVVGASIGIAIAPMDASNSDQLLKNADLALYRAKGDGRNTYRFFEPETRAPRRAGAVEDPGMCRSSLDGNREVPRLTIGGSPPWSASGRRGAVADDARAREVRLRHSSEEADEQSRATGCGVGGAKDGGRGECGTAKHAPGTGPGKRVPGAGPHTTSRKAKEEGEVHHAPAPHQHRAP